VNDLLDTIALHFPAEWVAAALTLNLICIWVVIGLFMYLNRYTRKERFEFWTASWMFYSVYLAATLSLQESPATPWLLMSQRAAIGVSALLMFWGSLQLTHPPRHPRELVGGVVFILLWSAVAAYRVGQSLWVALPVFALLAAASIYTGALFLGRRSAYRATFLLGAGFTFWGAHLLVLPFLGPTAPLLTAAHLASAALTLFIAVGMLVAQEQLVSEEDYRALFQSATDALLLVDCASLTVLEANRAAEQIAHGELSGRPLAEVFPDLRERMRDHWDAARVAEEINRVGEWSWQARVPCAVSAHLVRCPRGEVLQIAARDLSHQQRVAAELLVKHAALEAAENCILLSDREGRILWVNPAFTAMTGYTLQEALGEKAWFLKDDNRNPALHRELMRVLHGDQPWRGEVTNRRKDGTVYRERMTITPVRDRRGVLTNFVTIKEDLTARVTGSATTPAP